MRGFIFTDFLDFAESQFGLATVDSVITRCSLPSGGAYTTVGNYDHRDLVQMVIQLGECTGTPVPVLLRSFGTALFGYLARSHHELVAQATDAFGLLSIVDSHVHREVHKLYPGADLPQFDCEQTTPELLVLTYRSSRGFAELARGLIEGCLDHFGETASISMEDHSNGSNTFVRFEVRREGVSDE